MKKLALLSSAALSLLMPIPVFAADPTPNSIIISPPSVGYKSLSNFIQNALVLVFTVGAFLVLIMLIIGAYEWIASGGDKEAVGKARNRIINALVGLLVLAIAFALVNLIGQFTGINIQNLIVPSPNPSASGL